MMSRQFVGPALGVALLLAACSAPAAIPPAAAPSAAGPASPAALGWDQIVAAAKTEGHVSVIGPQGSGSTDGLTKGFQAKYPDIQVDYNGMAGNQISPKVLAEIAANQNSTDVIITGTTTAIDSLEPANALDSVPPYLVGPDDRDPTVWRPGHLDFADSAGQFNLVFSTYVKAPFIYNPTLVDPNQFTSYKDLLDPQWKGKIVWRDPRTAGGGLAVATFFYTTDSLGKQYIADLFKQDVVISDNDQQIMDWIARGQYAIALGPSDTLVNEYIARGLSVVPLSSNRMQEGGYVTSGNGSLVVPKGPPDPNATKVYLDWLLGQDGQTDWNKSQGFASERVDVSTEGISPDLVPVQGTVYQQNHSEPYVKMRNEIVQYLNSVIPQ